jgi:excisionase family DNA binding protein
MQNNSLIGNKLLNAREAAEYLNISLSTLHRMEHQGILIALRTPGGHRRYSLEMLNACLKPLPQHHNQTGKSI